MPDPNSVGCESEKETQEGIDRMVDELFARAHKGNRRSLRMIEPTPEGILIALQEINTAVTRLEEEERDRDERHRTEIRRAVTRSTKTLMGLLDEAIGLIPCHFPGPGETCDRCEFVKKLSATKVGGSNG